MKAASLFEWPNPVLVPWFHGDVSRPESSALLSGAALGAM